ncbi:hypothetical protein [Hafnia paralvei]|uniref:hypothetical protein n=1 Tax=Hafnia paralvei TaxID=546367 RepID=UPI0024B92C71|nr:hypothetical protein [Hafnia paralvei]MDX6839272.1 hypothetical protein [Hafnia paralvei]
MELTHRLLPILLAGFLLPNSRYQEVQENWLKGQENAGVKDASATMMKVSQMINDAMKE